MTRSQAERKAVELYPDDYSVYSQKLINKGKRAAFMKCFDLMSTGSLPMTREEAEKWAEMESDEAELRGAMSLYDHLASLSSAAQPATGYSEDQVREAMNKCFGRAVDGWFEMPESIADEILSSLKKKP